MDLTGYDSVIFTSGLNENAIHLFISQVQARWPSLLMDIEKPEAKEEIRGVISSKDCVMAIRGQRRSIVYFFRDEEMKQLFKDRGWVLDSSDEGPFSVHFRKRPKVLFELAGVNELASGENSVGSIDPYPAILCSSEILEITLVSPGDPAKQPFSQEILSLVSSSVLES